MPFSPFQKQPAYDSPPWGGFGVTEPESTTPTLHKMAGLAGAADLYMSSLRLWSDAAILAQFARKDLRSTPDDPNAIAKVHEANTTAQAARDVATAHGKKFEAVIVDYTRRYGKLPDGMENLTWAIRDHHNDMRKAATELARVNIEIEQIISHYSSATEQDGGKLMTWGNDCEMFGGNFEAAANDAIDELGEFLELAWAMGDPAKRDKRVTVVSGHTDPDGNKIETRATVEKQETTPKSDRLASSPPKASSPAPAQSDGRELGDYGD